MAVALRSFVRNPIAGKGGGEQVSGSKDAPASPMNAGVLDLIDEIHVVLRYVGAILVRDLVNQPGDSVLQHSSEAAIRTVNDGVDKALRIRKLYGQADDIIGLSATWEAKGAPCPHCSQFTLGGWAGSDNFSCTNCGGGMSRADYEVMCIVKVGKK